MVPMLKVAPRAIFGKLLFFFLPTKRPGKCMPFTRRALTQFHPQLMFAFDWLELFFKTQSNWKRDCGRRKQGNTQTCESSGAMTGKGKGSMVTRRKHASFVPGIRQPSDPELSLSCLSRGWVWQDRKLELSNFSTKIRWHHAAGQRVSWNHVTMDVCLSVGVKETRSHFPSQIITKAFVFHRMFRRSQLSLART